MELILKRIKVTKERTESLLYDADYPRLFTLSVFEPPIEGLSENPLCALSPGLYKVFIKAQIQSNSMIPRVQRVAQRPFFYFTPVICETYIPSLSFTGTDQKFQADLWCGSKNGLNIAPDMESYNRMITRMCIAKQNKEKVFIKVVNK